MRASGPAVAVIAALVMPPMVPTAAVGAPAVPPPSCRPTPIPHVPGMPRPSPPAADPALRAVGGERLATAGLVVPSGRPAPPPVTASSWLVADLDTGAVLGGCGPHEYGVPASVQKLLLAATMLPRLDPQQVITVTRGDMDIEPGSSAVGLVEGGRYRIETLWLGLLLKSGNEAANALARLGGGADGMAGGIRAMNEQARLLGAYQTHAATPSGLDGPGQLTSAYDLALIARACFADPAFRRYAATRHASIPAQPALRMRGFEIENDNQLLFHYPGALGGKTGYTDLARHTYVGAAQRGGQRLVVTLLGADVVHQRGWQQGAALLDWGFGLPRDSSVGTLIQPATATPTSAGPSPVAPAAQALPGGASGLGNRDRGDLLGWVRPAPALATALGLVVLAVAAAMVARRRRLGRLARSAPPPGEPGEW